MNDFFKLLRNHLSIAIFIWFICLMADKFGW